MGGTGLRGEMKGKFQAAQRFGLAKKGRCDINIPPKNEGVSSGIE